MSRFRDVSNSSRGLRRFAFAVVLSATVVGLASRRSTSATKTDGPAEVAALPSDAADNLALAAQLQAAQVLVAELKRADLLVTSMGDETRPKFAAAHKAYEELREEAIRRCSAARAGAADGKTASANFELRFNGVSSYVELPELKYAGEKPYTIEAIVSPTPLPGYQVNPETHQYAHHMALVSDSEFGGVDFCVHPQGLALEVNSADSGWYVTAAKECFPFVETRMHLAAVIDDDEVRLYRNGVLVDAQPHEGAVGPSPFTMRIGCSPHPVNGAHEFFCGCIDEVRFSSAALYSENYEPHDELTADGDTLALYHFDEADGDVARDASGHGRHGVIHDARLVRVGD